MRRALPPDRRRPTGNPPASCHRLRAAALVLVFAWGLETAAPAAEPAALPELARTTQRTFTIPFRLPKPQDPDADAVAERVLLEVSKDLGGSWTPAGEAAPAAAGFSYTADADGEYWFRLRAVDRKGRVRGGAGPDRRVLVDAAGPRLAARVWKGSDGEILCRYSAADDSIDLTSLTVEYRVGTGEWKKVATEGILAREAPAHLVGEDIWWAGEKVAALTVRIAVADAAGNRTTKQFPMADADPGVDQAALAAEVGVPPLPTTDPPPSVVAGTAPAAPVPVPPGGWKAESAAWPAGDAAAGDGRTTTVRRVATTAAPTDPDRTASTAGDASRLLTPAVPAPAADGRMEYRGRPLQLSRSRRFAWDYEPPAEAADGRRLRAELWTTQDGGVTWQRAAVDGDGRSPIDVTLPAAGLYGVRLELVADATAAAAGPRSGSAPDAWLGIDEEPPQVELVAISRDDSTPDGALVIRYAVRDPLIAPRATRLLYSPSAEGPWATIADGLENQGEHRWTPDRSVPAKVFVRAEAADLAGNVGAASSPDDVSIAAPRFGGKLGGLRPLPTAP